MNITQLHSQTAGTRLQKKDNMTVFNLLYLHLPKIIVIWKWLE